MLPLWSTGTAKSTRLQRFFFVNLLPVIPSLVLILYQLAALAYDLIGLVLWHIIYCWLFNIKSIFIHINSSISNIISTQFKCQKQFYSKQFGLVYVHCLLLFDPLFTSIWPLRAWVDLESVAIKRYSAFPKAPVLLEPQHRSDCLVSYRGYSLWGRTLLHRWSRCILQPQPTGELTVWLISLSSHNRHLLISGEISVFALTSLILIALFCGVFNRK